jgi:hypothetical protein
VTHLFSNNADLVGFLDLFQVRINHAGYDSLTSMFLEGLKKTTLEGCLTAK